MIQGLGFVSFFSVTILFTGFLLIYHEIKFLLNVSRPKTKRKKKNKENLFDYLDLRNSSAGKSFPFSYVFFQSQRTW